jgi:hypothetical protein
MIKVKTFITNSYNPVHHDRLDNSINKFLEENDVEVVDIKYSTSCCADSMDTICNAYIQSKIKTEVSFCK